MVFNKQLNKQKRKIRVRKKVKGFTQRPRLSVFRSGKHIYAQIINDESQTTLVSSSSLDKEFAENKHGGNCSVAELIGKSIAKKAKEQNITKVVFDRNGYLFHGRVKALAEGARAEGLEF